MPFLGVGTGIVDKDLDELGKPCTLGCANTKVSGIAIYEEGEVVNRRHVDSTCQRLADKPIWRSRSSRSAWNSARAWPNSNRSSVGRTSSFSSPKLGPAISARVAPEA